MAQHEKDDLRQVRHYPARVAFTRVLLAR